MSVFAYRLKRYLLWFPTFIVVSLVAARILSQTGLTEFQRASIAAAVAGLASLPVALWLAPRAFPEPEIVRPTLSPEAKRQQTLRAAMLWMVLGIMCLALWLIFRSSP
jgi:hypothetical protein